MDITCPRISASDIITINVGGVRFETLKETLKKYPHGHLANLDKESDHFCRERGEYFYDREPQVFAAILNYYRTGELHLPYNLCSVRLKHELQFWEIGEEELEDCCWWKHQEHLRWLDKQKQMVRLAQKSMFAQSTLPSGSETNERPVTGCCSSWAKWKSRLWDLLDLRYSSKLAEGFAWLSVLITLVSLFTLCAETHPVFRQNLTSAQYASIYNVAEEDIIQSWQYYGIIEGNKTLDGQTTEAPPKNYKLDSSLSSPLPVLETIDLVCHIFFILELLFRFVVCPDKRSFVTSTFNIIDLLSILPFAVDLTINYITEREQYKQTPFDVITTLRVIRVIRVVRIFRLVRRYHGLQVLIITLGASLNEVLLLWIVLAVGMFIFACLAYYADMETFHSIPEAFWWAIVTMTTVGYGDVTPKTGLGYLVGALCAICGVLVVAFTVPEIVSNYLLFNQCINLQAPRRVNKATIQQEHMSTNSSLVHSSTSVSDIQVDNLQCSK